MTEINDLTQSVIQQEKIKLQQEMVEFKNKIKQVTNSEKKRQKELFEAHRLELEKQSQKQLDIALNSLKLKKRNQILVAKQEIIDDYILSVKKAFEQLDPDSMKAIIQSVVETFDQKEQLELILGEKTKQLLGASQQFDVKVSGDVILGKAGFVLRQGSIEYNYLFDNLVNFKRLALQQIIVKSLFQKD